MKMKGDKVVITLELPPELLGDMDRAAEAEMLSRSAWLRRVIAAAVKQAAPKGAGQPTKGESE